MSIDESEQYLHQISQDDPDLYIEVKKYFLSFDDLLEMQDHIMRQFWKNPFLFSTENRYNPDAMA